MDETKEPRGRMRVMRSSHCKHAAIRVIESTTEAELTSGTASLFMSRYLQYGGEPRSLRGLGSLCEIIGHSHPHLQPAAQAIRRICDRAQVELDRSSSTAPRVAPAQQPLLVAPEPPAPVLPAPAPAPSRPAGMTIAEQAVALVESGALTAEQALILIRRAGR